MNRASNRGPRRYFDFSISYASENADVAGKLASLLQERGARIFFDKSCQTSLYGRRLSDRFKSVYGPATRFFVPLISSHYQRKVFTNYELNVALSEADSRESRFIIPLRLDDTQVLGLHSDLTFVDLRVTALTEAADTLMSVLSEDFPRRKLAPAPVYWVVTLGTIVEEAEVSAPPDAPRDYVSLCDWLEDNVVSKMEDLNPGCHFAFTEPSERDGEALSVRLGFKWSRSWSPSSVTHPECWDLLEIVPYRELYADVDPASELA